jgi:hypothetical protein
VQTDACSSPYRGLGIYPQLVRNEASILGEVDFWIFLDFQFTTVCNSWEKQSYNSKTKVQKGFFFIFMSSYAEMSFLK